MANQKIREYAKEKNILLWEVADKLGLNDGNFSRKLRKELSKEKTKEILALIDVIAKEKGV